MWSAPKNNNRLDTGSQTASSEYPNIVPTEPFVFPSVAPVLLVGSSAHDPCAIEAARVANAVVCAEVFSIRKGAKNNNSRAVPTAIAVSLKSDLTRFSIDSWHHRAKNRTKHIRGFIGSAWISVKRGIRGQTLVEGRQLNAATRSQTPDFPPDRNSFTARFGGNLGASITCKAPKRIIQP